MIFPLGGTSPGHVSIFATVCTAVAAPTLSRIVLAGVQHKDLWPLDGRDVAGLTAAVGGLVVAAGGGIGGGALLVPILILILSENSHVSRE